MLKRIQLVVTNELKQPTVEVVTPDLVETETTSGPTPNSAKNVPVSALNSRTKTRPSAAR
jgi:hypothetical protein